jgi:uncharacterized membrane protein YhdT
MPLDSTRFRFVPARLTHAAFGFLLSGLMTWIVSAVATVRNVGWKAASVAKWFNAFSASWPITFPTVLIVAPIVRRIVTRLTHLPKETQGPQLR